MKLTFLFILATCLQAVASGFSQTVDLSVRNATAEEVFRSIERQTSLGFIYAREQLKGLKNVDITVRRAPVSQVLDLVFRDSELTYVVSGGNVIIRQRVRVAEAPARVEPPPVTVSGRITDEEGQPMAQVSVVVRSTGKGVTSGADGTYAIEVAAEGETLVFSSVGYEPVEYRVVRGGVYNLTLKRSVARTEEIVVVGYGTQRKSDVTGSVASLPRERLQQLPNTNIAQALQGSVPGLQINTNGGGAEDNNVSILIRGRNSISASNSPLIIWDGIPYEGGISEINPNDIESIEVLKDASASAIYGSRGSNGVILITSKQGRKGRLSITYDGFQGVQTFTNRPDLMNGEQFYQFKKTRLNAGNIISPAEQAVYDAGQWVDWYDLATRQGSRTQHSLSLNGGSDRISFYLGATYLDVSGVSENDRFRRYSLRPSLEVKVTDWLTVSSSTQFSYQNRDGLPVEFFDTRNTGGGANFFNPLTTPFNADGTPRIYAYDDYPPSRNPLSNTLVPNTDNAYRVFSANSARVDFPFLKGLSFKVNSGVEFENNARKTYWGRNVALGLETGGTALNYQSVQTNTTLENILNYTRTFGRHNVNLTGLYSSQSNRFDRDQLEGQGFPNDVLTNYQMSAATLLTPSSANFSQNLVSQMGRLNYGFDGRYLLTLTARRDGYSAFGAGRKYGVFPSAALAWNLHREAFLAKQTLFSTLKLRASYGMNGNQAVSSYSSLAKLSSAPYLTGTTVLPGYVPSSLANDQLGWETTRSLTIGLDFGILRNRISGTVDVYSARTQDLLLNRTISSVQGFTRILQNIGKTANQGLEIGLTTQNLKRGDFAWTTAANLTLNRNEIVDLYGDGKDDIVNAWFIGKPINVIYGLQYDGIFRSAEEVANSVQRTAKPGWVRVRNVNGDSVINASDRTILGYEDPRFLWGLTNTFKYKGLSLMVFFHGVRGATKRNPLEDDNVFTDVRRNTTVKDWWSPTNPNGTHFANDGNANPLGVNFFERSDFARLKDVSMAFELPGKWLDKAGVGSWKVYATGRNLATFTRYRGLDPELTDQLGLPLQKEVIVGMTLTF
jgi:TonB-linked SusC/RagA family outer membrane protein